MRLPEPTRTRTRPGFTLVELLVAAALSILIMAVMATAFQTGLQTLSTLKSIGDMAERLITADTMLRSDLEAEHFATVGGGTAGTRGDDSPSPLRLSDLRYDMLTSGGGQAFPPPGGYFQIFNGSPSIVEGLDADGLLSSRAGAGENHRLSMTNRRQGGSQEQLFSGDLSLLNAADQAMFAPPNPNQNSSDIYPGNRLVTQWGQIDWFLDYTRPTTLNGVPTWPLVRRVRVIGTNSVTLTSPQDAFATLSVSTDAPPAPPTNRLNTPQSITPLSPRFGNSGPNASTVAGSNVGDDIVITNVVSFEVKAMWAPGPGVPAPRAAVPFPLPSNPSNMVPNGDFPFDDLPVVPTPTMPENTTPGVAGNRIFDTMSNAPGWNVPGNANSIPLRIRIIAVQVKIRVYDPKNKLARQTTLVVKM